MNLGTNNKLQKKGITLVIPNPCGIIKETKMKNSGVEWIGEIPDDWEVTQVKSIFNIGRGRVIAQTELDEHGKYPVYSSQTKDNGCLGYINTYDFDINQLTWTTDGANAGTVFLRKGKHNCTNVCGTLQLKQTSNILLFYKYALEYLTIFNKRADTNGFKIMNNEMAKIITLLPPKETQQRIATFLDKKCSKIEETIQNQQQVIEKLKAYKQSLITEAVTGKIKIQNGKVCGKYESYKDSGVEWIGKIPSGWISTRVGHLYKSMLGKMVCPNQLTEEHSLQKYLCAMNVHFDGVDLSEIKEMWFTPNEMNQYQVRNGDLLVVEGGAGAGGASIVYGISENDKIFIQNSIHLVKPVKTNYLPKYLYYWIYSLVKQNYIDYTCNKATIPHFTKEKLEEMPIAISDKITQQEIIVYLDKKCTVIDTAIEQKQNLIEELTEYKKSLIYECVTGKKEI